MATKPTVTQTHPHATPEPKKHSESNTKLQTDQQPSTKKLPKKHSKSNTKYSSFLYSTRKPPHITPATHYNSVLQQPPTIDTYKSQPTHNKQQYIGSNSHKNPKTNHHPHATLSKPTSSSPP